MNETKLKGLTTELQCATFFTSLGYNVSTPLGEDCKYDMIVDIGQLLRVQVKTCHSAKTGITFYTTSSYLTTNGAVRNYYSEDDIDFFATYFDNQCYLIPVEQCTGNQKTLTFTRQITNAEQPACMDDYKAEVIIQSLIETGTVPNNKKQLVLQLDENGQVIATYNSYGEAARAVGAGSNGAGHVSEAARGLRSQAYGYRWMKK